MSEFVKVEVGKIKICRGKNGYLGPSLLSNPWWYSLLDICCVTAPKLISLIVAKSDFDRYFVFHYFTDTAPQIQTTPQCTWKMWFTENRVTIMGDRPVLLKVKHGFLLDFYNNNNEKFITPLLHANKFDHESCYLLTSVSIVPCMSYWQGRLVVSSILYLFCRCLVLRGLIPFHQWTLTKDDLSTR